jgi:hypothetical protein
LLAILSCLPEDTIMKRRIIVLLTTLALSILLAPFVAGTPLAG